MTSLKCKADILKVDFVINGLKDHNLAKSRKFKLPKSKIKGHWGQKTPSS